MGETSRERMIITLYVGHLSIGKISKKQGFRENEVK
jgi:hypothetical protein